MFRPTPATPKPIMLFGASGASIRLTGFINAPTDPIVSRLGEADVFNLAQKFGSLGILAHNTLSGQQFANILPGETMRLVNDDGSQSFYRVSEVRRYQALTPSSPFSDFVDLNTGTRSTTQDLFYSTYNKSNPLVLQTCIERNGDINWGRLFVIAQPAQAPTTYKLQR